jgi:hypothetical protein
MTVYVCTSVIDSTYKIFKIRKTTKAMGIIEKLKKVLFLFQQKKKLKEEPPIFLRPL